MTTENANQSVLKHLNSLYAEKSEPVAVKDVILKLQANDCPHFSGLTKNSLNVKVGKCLKELSEVGTLRKIKRGFYAPLKAAPSKRPVVMSDDSLQHVSKVKIMSDHPYSDDPGLRRIATKRLPCLGFFNPRSKICGECVFQPECKAEVPARKAEIAHALFEAERMEVVRHAQIESTRTKLPSNSALARSLKKEGWRKVKAAVTSNCCLCHQSISKGTLTWWKSGSGIAHESCLLEKVSKEENKND